MKTKRENGCMKDLCHGHATVTLDGLCRFVDKHLVVSLSMTRRLTVCRLASGA